MNDRDDEALLALYRRSRNEQPSEILDQRIRQAALRVSNRRQRNWIWSLSKVAVVVLSFSVVLQLWMDSQPTEELVIQQEQTTKQLPGIVLPSRSVEIPQQEELNESQLSDENIIQRRSLQESTVTSGTVDDDRPSASTIDRFAVTPEPAATILSDDSLPSESPALLPDYEPTVTVIIPDLPANLAELSSLAPAITGRETTPGNIDLFIDDARILSIVPEGQTLRFRAWRVSESLGIQVDWSLEPDQLSDCVNSGEYLGCPINPQVTGFFQGQRLEYIEWLQSN